MSNLFTRHPHSVQETFCEHFCFAAGSGMRMIIAGLACITHAFFPFCFKSTASAMMYKLTDEMRVRAKSVEEKSNIMREN